MRLVLVLATLVLSTAPAFVRAQETGRTFYLRYCASCHGVDGRGDGPARAAFTKPPTDLTGLAAAAGGKYPYAEVMASIDGRRAVAAHGSRDMPVWGEQLRAEMKDVPYRERTTLLKEREIVEYIGTIQRRARGSTGQ